MSAEQREGRASAMAVKKRKTPAAPATARAAEVVETAASAAKPAVSAAETSLRGAAEASVEAAGHRPATGEASAKANGEHREGEAYAPFGGDDMAALVRANAALVKGFEEMGE